MSQYVTNGKAKPNDWPHSHISYSHFTHANVLNDFHARKSFVVEAFVVQCDGIALDLAYGNYLFCILFVYIVSTKWTISYNMWHACEWQNGIFGQHGVLVEICHSRSDIVQHPDTLKSAAHEQIVECFVDISRCIFMLTQNMHADKNEKEMGEH